MIEYMPKAPRQGRQYNLSSARHIIVLLVVYAAAQCCAFASPIFLKSSTGKHKHNALQLLYGKMSRLKASQQEGPSASSIQQCFPHHGSPYLTVITEPDACDSEERMSTSFQAISSAVSTGKVALVSVRVVQPQHEKSPELFEKRVVELTRQLVALSSEYPFRVVVTSDYVDAAIQSSAHGIHVKERHRSRITEIREQFAPRIPLIGTSAHSVSSALEATSLYRPDYIFVGTCYATASHPEKVELEGPALPGTVCRALEEDRKDRPVVLAIGGIDEDNCAEPVVEHGADGVAAIRSVLQSPDPALTVDTMLRNIRGEDQS